MKEDLLSLIERGKQRRKKFKNRQIEEKRYPVIDVSLLNSGRYGIGTVPPFDEINIWDNDAVRYIVHRNLQHVVPMYMGPHPGINLKAAIRSRLDQKLHEYRYMLERMGRKLDFHMTIEFDDMTENINILVELILDK